ncbi:hypothetical protein KP78_13450 [Jeotgalibacillus soli]|uniref:Uncharacterized protein n=2 Tax=Jeotgalibacillus soli TaxID=889306 RepID=A0A0C2VLT1_9BACL|nr:hypothetical protein KP78_13450 [Jeotgalibacillus soli]
MQLLEGDGSMSFEPSRQQKASVHAGQQMNSAVLKENKELLRKQIAAMVEGLTKPYTPISTKRRMRDLIEKKRLSTTSKQQYKDSLIKNIIFYKEVQKEISTLIIVLMNQNRFLHPAKLDGHIIQIQDKIKLEMDEHIKRHYDYYYERYMTNDEGINGLEREYIDHSLLNSWLIDSCFYLQKHGKWGVEQELENWVKEEIEKKYLREIANFIYY